MSKEQTTSILVIGVGNYGGEYENTPHNIGLVVIDELIQRIKKHKTPLRQDYERQLRIKEYEKSYAFIYEWDADGKQIIAAKSKTFMNESGTAVQLLAKSYKLKDENLWIVHDDIDLPIGQVKVQFDRSAAGHKGVQDIVNKLGTQKFYRFRVGVRPERTPTTRTRKWMNNFVIKKLRGKNKELYEQSAKYTAELIQRALGNSTGKMLGSYTAQQKSSPA